MFVSPELSVVPSNMTPIMNIDSESIVLIPSDSAILENLIEQTDIGMLVISEYDWGMIADDLDLDCWANVAGVDESYFADRCKLAEKEVDACISRQGYAAIFNDQAEIGFSTMDSIKRIPTVVRTYHEETVDSIITRANLDFDVVGLTDMQKMAAAIGVITENSDTNYDRHYEVDGITMILYTAHEEYQRSDLA